jgi:hypothetical protein
VSSCVVFLAGHHLERSLWTTHFTRLSAEIRSKRIPVHARNENMVVTKIK